MKTKVTKKYIKETNTIVYSVHNYIDMQQLLKSYHPFAYSTRAEGVACEYYQAGGVCFAVSCGDASGFKNIDNWKLVNKYNEKAKKIWNNDKIKKYSTKQKKVDDLLNELIVLIAEPNLKKYKDYKIYKYLLQCLKKYNDDYELNLKYNKDRIKYILNEFESTCNTKQDKKENKLLINRIEYYFQGPRLIDFRSYKIIKLGLAWGLCKDTEKSKEKFIYDIYYKYVSGCFLKLAQLYNIDITYLY